MTRTHRYYASHTKTLKTLGLLVIFLLFLLPTSYSQNTKGDRTETKSGKRESRFRLSQKKKAKAKKPYNRVQGRRLSPASRASASRPPKFYPQKGPFVNNKSTTAKISKQNRRLSRSQVNGRSVSGQQARRNASSPRVRARSATGSTRNIYPQRGPYVNNPSRKPRSVERPISNRQQVARTKRISHKPDPPRRRRVTPNSASRSYVSRRSINAFAGFWNRKPKGEKAYIGDISGRKLRTKNFETKKPKVIKPSTSPYYGRKRVGDKPYKGRAGGGHVSATRSGKAWKGDIAGRKIRGRNFSSKRTVEGRPIFPPKKSRQRVGDKPYKGSMPGGGYKSVSGKVSKGKGPVPVKTPGIGANKIGTYKGNIRARRAFSPQGADYTGNMKSRKPLKGGGSVSGKGWNNKGVPIGARTPSSTAAKAGRYQGNIKAGRPLKGGGSVSGKLWNNKQTPIPTRIPAAGAEKAAEYRGSYKQFSLKPGMRDQGEEFTGYRKTRKPLKGGGSVSGKIWNNKEQPIEGKAPSKKIRMDIYQGNVKVSKKAPSKEIGGFPGKYYDSRPSIKDQGEEFTGNIKQQDHKKRPHGAKGSMPGIAPGKNSVKASEFSKAMRLKWNYKHNPNSADDALDTREPGKAFARATDYQGNIKMKKYNLFGKKELHPDAQFVKTNKNNTDDERDMLTNFKLWWARLFKKSDTQPEHLKQKVRKPRYDKGEQGMWYD